MISLGKIVIFLGKIAADIEWQFRWQTWLVRYLQATTWIAIKLGRCSVRLHKYNLRLLDKMGVD